jgi:hypothetical protein
MAGQCNKLPRELENEDASEKKKQRKGERKCAVEPRADDPLAVGRPSIFKKKMGNPKNWNMTKPNTASSLSFLSLHHQASKIKIFSFS